MYSLTESPDVVVCSETGAWITRGGSRWEEYEAWVESGNTPHPYLPYAMHSPEHYAAMRAKAWDWMAAYVRGRRYDSIETCVGYYNSGVARYRAEARAMVAWRDDVNMTLEALVMNPPPDLATWGQLEQLLPQPEAYDWPAPVELPMDGVPPVSFPAE